MRRRRIPDWRGACSARSARWSGGWRRDAELRTMRLRQPDVEVLRRERIEGNRARRDDVLEPAVEPGRVDLQSLLEQPLLDADVAARRSFGLEVRVAKEERRRAEGLDDRRLFHAEADVGLQ